jgi:hypothetical protein
MSASVGYTTTRSRHHQPLSLIFRLKYPEILGPVSNMSVLSFREIYLFMEMCKILDKKSANLKLFPRKSGAIKASLGVKENVCFTSVIFSASASTHPSSPYTDTSEAKLCLYFIS